jgi:tRNA dimethylallyltransferase
MAIELGQHLKAEILSADSRQLYAELCIGVARPEPEELRLVKHHFIGNISISEDYTAGRYGREARIFADTYFQQHEHLVVCGGTGLYIKAFLEGIDRNPANEEVRAMLEMQLENNGLASLVEELSSRNPALAAETDLHNPRRILRALEWEISGGKKQETGGLPADWKVIKMAPNVNRETLYARINQRVEKMLASGLWEEAERHFPQRHLNALHTVGYREIFDCMEGKYNFAEAVEKIKQHTRNYAKRQLTWFRKDPDIHWIERLNLSALPE